MNTKIILVLLLLTAVGLQDALAAPSVVEIKNIAFNPANITISKGTTVIWMQNESSNVVHTVTSDAGIFDSGTLSPGQTFNWTFNETGTFKYHCLIHPTIMLGTVIVTEAPAAANISGMKFNDSDGNGIRESNESGLSNWTIDLNYTNGTIFRTTTTDMDGNYNFKDVPSGNYTVQEILKPGWMQTAPSEGKYNLTLSAGENVTGKDFGNFKTAGIVTSITISPSTTTLTAGATQTFTAKALDQKDAPIAGININFTSDNTTVGTVAPENMLTGADGIATTTFMALAAGTAMVTAANGSVTGNAIVSVVVEQNLTTIAVSPPSISLTVGDTQTFTASPKDQDGAAFPATVTWTSSNTTVGTVDSSGNFTALAPGTSMVNATNGSVIGTAIVTVAISVDIIPPMTTISGVTENGSFNNSVTVILNATDNTGGSGVNETFYMVKGGSTTTYSEPFVVDSEGPDNVTYWSTDRAGNVEAQKMVNFTIVKIPQVNVTAIREIKTKSILPGESTNITVGIISGNANALALHEIPPEGWNVTRGTDSADAFKNSTNEWVWKSMETNTTVTYTLTAPVNISIGTYQIKGTIMDANGTLTNVEGDNSVKIDILEFYRRLGNDPGIVETTDLLRAFDDFRNNIAPQGFNRPLSADEVDKLVNEWINS
jgi:plastocyanin